MKNKIRINFGTVSVTKKAERLILQALAKNRISAGKYVREFEEKFARLIGTTEAVALSSGTDADALALAVLYDFGAKRQDEIIIPALSFVATGNAVLQAGFRPVFVDVERQTLNIDASRIEEVITQKTRAIMPVHLMGKPADMDTINRIAKKYKLFVIEDAAEAYGAIYKGKAVGRLADMAAFSLYVAHMITTGEGGIVVTDRSDFAEILRSLRAHGRACKCNTCVLNTASSYCAKRFKYGDNRDIRFIFERIGFSSKMNELEAAVGLGNLDIYPAILKKRRKNLTYLMEKFREFQPYLYTIREEPNEQIGPHAFAIILGKEAKFTRDKFVYFLEKHGIDSRSLFLSMPTQCPGFKYLGYKLGDFPNAEYIGDNGLHIGIHQEMGQKELDYVLNLIKVFLLKNN
ncbi:MAG: DegT/DnrJ/EryC1/StrS family aminotransferase [Candidatus Omnitrophica bacterium]|nr:DegT/DnrJ/EryC1/StrS family aminotransferase [Candidatus Omnitrophota bacterium]